MPTHCLYWLKRDFRLEDNPALTAAAAAFGTVTPLFVLEPSALAAPETSALHLHAQCDAFNDFARAVAAGGGQPGFAYAEVVDVLDRLHAKRPLTHLVSHQETGNNRTFARDRAVGDWCSAHGVDWQEHQQIAVFRGTVDRDRRHRSWQAFMQRPCLPPIEDLQELKIPDEYTGVVETAAGKFIAPAAPPALPTDRWMPDPDLLGTTVPGYLSPERFGKPLTGAQRRYVQPVSETAARQTLATFLDRRAIDYSKGMSSPNTAFYHCSRLSVHFAWGTISVRTAFQRTHARIDALKAEGSDRSKLLARNLRSFLSRLHWHDHFTQRLETEVEMEHRPLNPNFYDLRLENDPLYLRRWVEGRTGWPMVDACLRCMATTGYLNFRMRSMITSAATHLLHLDYRSIDKPMARMYTDYEPGIHLAQLQMQAGMVGINTLRTYSPEKQMTDHDPNADFVHHWVPELRPFTAAAIGKRPQDAPLGEYPHPPVERIARAKEYKQLLGDLKFRPGGREITERVFAKHGSRRGPRRKPKKGTKT